MNKPTDIKYADMTPQDVVKKIFLDEISPTRAWREYRGLTQQDMATRLKMPVTQYAQHEARKKLSKPVRMEIAAALCVAPDLLDV